MRCQLMLVAFWLWIATSSQEGMGSIHDIKEFAYMP